MTTPDLESLCHACVEIAREAGNKIMQIYQGEFSVESKDDNTPLTCADLAAHHHIVAALTELTPHIPVLSEEAADIPFDVRQTWDYYWLVDPLDGTREFIKRNGEFTVNIALIHQHKSILGVINAPVMSTDYFAYAGGGAFKSVNQGRAEAIHCRKISSSQIIVAGSRSHASSRLQQYLKNLGDYSLMSMGSSLKSCLVAEGKADIYPRLGLTSEWDTAAAQCIVEEAGGRITQTNMQTLRYNTKDCLLNPDFFVFGDDSINWNNFLP